MGFENGFVAVVVGEFDLEGTVVLEFGGADAGDRVMWSNPTQVKPISSGP